MTKRKKTILIICAAAVVLAAAVWLLARGARSGTANVYAVSDLADRGGWYSQDLTGTITEGSVENVPLQEGLIESINVHEGDTVQKGDLLLKYDTASYQLTLETDAANIKLLESQIAQTQQDIVTYRNTTPAERITPPPTPTPKPAPATVSTVAPDTAPAESADGARVYFCTADTVVTGALLKSLQTAGGTAAFRVYDGASLLGVWEVDGAELAALYPADWAPADWTLGAGLTLAGDGTAAIDFSAPHYGTFQSTIPDAADDDESIDDPAAGAHTAAELAALIRDKNNELKNLQRQLQSARIQYQKDQLTSETGEVRAADSGVVTFVGDPAAIHTGETILTVKGSVNGTVTVYVDELSRDAMKPGDTVDVYSYESGASFTATVQSISDKPAEDGAYGSVGTSYYPVTCIADDADVELNVGEYCGVTLSGESESDTLYLQLPFVRSDSGGSYVLAERDGRLEKRYVATGGYLWGNYVEIRSGLTWDDAIAFPYGRTAREGNRAQQADISELYNY